MEEFKNYLILLRPLVGAGIGYITNLIAVKMLFHPIKPIKLGKFTLPFTPGIIPKNQSRLAHSIASSISNKLLTEETLKNSLLSDNMKEKLKLSINSYLEKNHSEKQIKNYLSALIGEENLLKEIENIKQNLTNNIYESILSYNVGNLISNELINYCNNSLQNSTIGKLFGKGIIKKISENSEEKINEYIKNNGKDLIYDLIDKEFNKYSNSTSNDIINLINNSNLNINNIALDLYESFITNNLKEILNYIDISTIIENKIASMDILELENIILKILKKELNSLVNLGALIGFVLGLINLFI